MNMITNLNTEQALRKALTCVGIENEECDCLFKRCEDGLYYFLVRTSWMKDEFYVEAGTGEVLGINTEPVDDREGPALWEPADDTLSAVA